ncbi:hypothetical protein bcgnr5371_42950 [Bacillus cereus]
MALLHLEVMPFVLFREILFLKKKYKKVIIVNYSQTKYYIDETGGFRDGKREIRKRGSNRISRI